MPEFSQKSELRSKLVRYAANILSRRPYFRHQLKQKLFLYTEKLGSEPDVSLVNQIIIDLAKSGYLDDQYLSDAFVRRQLDKCYGPQLIKYKLKHLGVPDTIISQSLKTEATPEILTQTTEKLKQKFHLQDPRKLRQKLYQRGFGGV